MAKFIELGQNFHTTLSTLHKILLIKHDALLDSLQQNLPLLITIRYFFIARAKPSVYTMLLLR
jgi:hypothetical protein